MTMSQNTDNYSWQQIWPKIQNKKKNKQIFNLLNNYIHQNNIIFYNSLLFIKFS